MFKIIISRAAIIFLAIAFIKTANAVTRDIDDKEDYNVKNISAQLRNDAPAVVRADYIYFEVKDEERAVMKVKNAVTIFKKNNQDYGELTLSYNKFVKIEDLEGKIYDSDGKEVRELDDDEIKDYSSFDAYTLYADNRAKTVKLYYDKYPYTVEFTYEIDYDGFLGWPSWSSRSESSTDPVEHSSIEVKVPRDYEFRYWCNVDSVKPIISDEKKYKLYTWKLDNLPKLPDNTTDEDLEDYATIVLFAPSIFKVDDYEGRMSSWKEFGSWNYNLYKNEDNLPGNVKNEIAFLIKDITNTKDKIYTLYRYMQARTRYVSVQLGIGGWKPFNAEYVHSKGYGDCKALSNYMISLLKTAGIVAYPVLVNSGHPRWPLIKEFPSNQFNHVIVCVPVNNDSLWLECTSQITPPGFLGSFTENREALMITPEGGVIVRTPSSIAPENIQIKNINVILSAYNTEVDGKIFWLGDQHDQVRSIDKELIPEDKEKWILNLLTVPDIKLNNYSFNIPDQLKDEIELKLNLSLPKYATVSGTRMFFNPNLMERRTSVPKDYPERHSPVRLKYPYLDIDTIKYIIPEGYSIESIPGEVNIVSSFGKFNSKTIQLDAASILYSRSLEIKDYMIPASNYPEYKKFFADVVKADRGQVVLKKQN